MKLFKKIFEKVSSSDSLQLFLFFSNLIIIFIFVKHISLVVDPNLNNLQIIFNYPIFFLSIFFFFIFLLKIFLNIFNAKTKNSKFIILIVPILSIFIFLFLNPFEEFLGGRDPGNYISNAYRIATEHKINSTPPLLIEAQANKSVNVLFHYESFRPAFVGHQGYYFLGQYINDNTIIPQFFHLSSTTVSPIIYFLGLNAVKYSVLFLYLAITISLYFFLKTFIIKNNFSIFLAILLWLTSPAILFWSRSFNSESFVSFFILIMMLNVHIFFKDGKLFWLISAIVCFISAALTRGTPILFLPLITYVISTTNKKNFNLSFIFFSILLTLSVWIMFKETYPYASSNFAGIFKPLGITQEIIFNNLAMLPLYVYIPSVLLIFLFKFTKLFINKIFFIFKKIIVFLKLKYLGAIIPLLVLFIYQLTMFSNYFSNRPNLIKISWYIGGLVGLFFFSFGIVIYFLHILTIKNKKDLHQNISLIIFSSILLISFLFFLKDSRISMDHPWWSRRFLDNALLLFPITTIFSLNYLYKKIRFKTLAICVFIILLASNLYYSVPILKTQQYKGSLEFIEKVSNCINQNQETETIIFDTSYTSTDFDNRLKYLAGYFFGQPLSQYEKFIVIYPPDRTKPENLIKAVSELKTVNKQSIYVINPSNEFKKLENVILKKHCLLSFDMQMIGWESIPNPMNLTTDNKLLKKNALSFDIPFEIYKLEIL